MFVWISPAAKLLPAFIKKSFSPTSRAFITPGFFSCAILSLVEDRDAARKEIEDVPGIEITGALPMNLEINAAGVNKGKAMIELGKLLGIPREEIMAFGDGNNDLKMLKEVGTGVAMENAIPSVKEAAEYVTLSNDEEGVAKFIEKYVLD